MAANEHKNLTDVNRHNPKGFESATNDTLLSKTVGTGTNNTDGSLLWVKKNIIKVDSYDIQGYAVLSNGNYHYAANMTDGQSPNEYNVDYGASTLGNAELAVGDFFKVKSFVMHQKCTLNTITMLANATSNATITVALCKVTFVAGSTTDVTPILLNELSITGQSSNDNIQSVTNASPEKTLEKGDVLFAMVKASNAATTFFKLGIGVGYDN
tara:strand:+ start:1849 stop:2484 length:636 start_codon:yes stop_codon:yes gene_type:complete